MKFFISHKREDDDVVKRIHLLLKIKGIDSYLDLVDSNKGRIEITNF